MTVKELIKKLQKFDEETEVVFDSDSEGIYMPISDVGFCKKPYDRTNPVVEIREFKI
jgi:hypothetical protein